MRLALHGESEAFGEIFQRHADRVYHHCFRRLGSWSAAEDATSLVFLETWRRRTDAIPAAGSLLPWLLGVANNVTRNLHRTARRYDTALYRMSAAPLTTPDHSDDVAGRIDDERRLAPVLRELRTLPRPDQDVIALVLMSGLTYAEAAVALGVPVGTVRSRLSRARKRIALPHLLSEES
ncbi:RNA polymerase sigma-70 factor (ECF subfamily) [Catenuloplanes nepalensis]|uniref:RNA polymerase sigma-70 factor (ECF subfamily) n=1 Tax=Catenuloplanes nepalensis TaxID=587533 RepID=A0ABT9N2W5_9ACTN|nr:RNA polymerase sigma factor [Catenuloplanes nepalensis]MDP9797631.1 RNA polymerase sigma-70 factor (ECF subfamily) [Catenuloplanes nepalensis]